MLFLIPYQTYPFRLVVNSLKVQEKASYEMMSGDIMEGQQDNSLFQGLRDQAPLESRPGRSKRTSCSEDILDKLNNCLQYEIRWKVEISEGELCQL